MKEWEWHLLEDKAPVETIDIGGVAVRPGDRVRLCPRGKGDVFDMALAGKIATIQSIEQDYEGQFHVSVVVDDDPGREIGMARQPAHRFFFSAAELEPVDPSPATRISEKRTRILIAGMGNVFLGDDAFGVEVANRMANLQLPPGVRVADFGIRSYDLAYALADGADVTILVDACARGGSPGDLYVIEPDVDSFAPSGIAPANMDAHSMNVVNVIRAAQAFGGRLKKLLLLGCEPQTFGPEEGQMGLSEPMAAAVERAIPLLQSLVQRILNGQWPVEPAKSSTPAVPVEDQGRQLDPRP